MKKLIFKDNSSGTVQHFPFVGNWKSGEEKPVEDKIAIVLLEFPSVQEVMNINPIDITLVEFEVIEEAVKEKILPVLKKSKKKSKKKEDINLIVETDIEEA